MTHVRKKWEKERYNIKMECCYNDIDNKKRKIMIMTINNKDNNNNQTRTYRKKWKNKNAIWDKMKW